MAVIQRFSSLPKHDRLLLACAVLLDGFDAAEYLQYDKENGPKLSKLAYELASIPAETRLPMLGTLLRRTLHEQ